MKSQSKDFPVIRKLQGKILVPYNVKQVTLDSEEGETTAYEFDLYRHDVGSDVNNLEYWKQVVWKLLQQDLHTHVYGIYDQGEQATISAYGARAIAAERQDIIDECIAVQDWIDAVLDYYDQRKNVIFAATSETELLGVTWDFPRDKPCVDRKDWRDIKGMF